MLLNKKNGTNFENDYALFLNRLGYWVSPFPGKNYSNSQPADLIACKNNIPYLIDCKIVENVRGIFQFERIERNQRLANKMYKKFGNHCYFLVFLWNNCIYEIELDSINLKEKSLCLKNYIPVCENFSEIMEKIYENKSK